MTLRERLDRQAEVLATDPLVRETVAATMAALARAGIGEAALRPGDPFPDVLLPDTAGALVGRLDLVARGPAVVTFLRGEWCPFCAIMMDALEEALPAVGAAGGSLFAILPETGGRAEAARRRHGAHYPVLVDVDHGLAAACGLVFRAPAPYRRMLEGAGLDLAERQGNAAWLLPVPASFVLDRRGRVVWAFVDPDFRRRAEPAAVIAAVRRAASG